MAKVTQVDFPPRELVSYSKETQTPVSTQPKDGTSHTLLSTHTLKMDSSCVRCLYYNSLCAYSTAEEEPEEEDLAVAPAALESPQENEPHAEEEEGK